VKRGKGQKGYFSASWRGEEENREASTQALFTNGTRGRTSSFPKDSRLAGGKNSLDRRIKTVPSHLTEKVKGKTKTLWCEKRVYLLPKKKRDSPLQSPWNSGKAPRK